MKYLNLLMLELDKTRSLISGLLAKKIWEPRDYILMDNYMRKDINLNSQLDNLGTNPVILIYGVTEEPIPKEFRILYAGISKEEAIYTLLRKLKTPLKWVKYKDLPAGKLVFGPISELLD